jgi:hypothetical protein
MKTSFSNHKLFFVVVVLALAASWALAGCSASEQIVNSALAASEEHSHAAGVAEHSHDEIIEIAEGQIHPTITAKLYPDAVAGWNLYVETSNFRFAPEHASQEPVLGEGHAHIYVDGVKLARLYTNWFHIAKLDPGAHNLVVSLNGNNHAAYYYAGQPVEAALEVEVADESDSMADSTTMDMTSGESDESLDHSHAPGTAAHDHSAAEAIEIDEGKTHPTVALSVTPDPMSGWNVHIETTDFRFAPEHASGADVLGEGHAHLYVDGVKLARVYGNWFHIGSLEAGRHEIKVNLNGNSHAPYHYAGQPVEAAVLTEIVE